MQWRRVLPWFAWVALIHLYFLDQPSWNQNSRLALTRALVEDQSVTIDRFAHTTGDRSLRDGHRYSDKAPGVSWLAVPGYALFAGLRLATGANLPESAVHSLDPQVEPYSAPPLPSTAQSEALTLPVGDRLVYAPSHRWALWACRITAVLPVLLAGLYALFRLALALHATPREAAITVGLYAFCTPALPYGTALYGHRPCADALLIAFALLALHPRRRISTLAAGLAGTALAWAVLFEYPAVPIALLVTAWAGWRHGGRALALLLLAALPWALLLGCYHHQAFGAPWHTGYDFVELTTFANGMRVNYGFGWPNPTAAAELLLGSYRGLLPLCPVVLTALCGWLCLPGRFRRPEVDGNRSDPLGGDAALVALLIVAYQWLQAASYYMWDGGAALGPRHLVGALPFLALGWVVASRRLLPLTLALGFFSAVTMITASYVRPEAPQGGHPWLDYMWPRLIDSSLLTGPTTIGHALGLPSLLALLPLVVLSVLVWPRSLGPGYPAKLGPTP